MVEFLLHQREKQEQKRVVFLYPSKQFKPINPSNKHIPTQICVDKDDNKDDNENDDEDDSKVEFFIKEEKKKKKIFFNCFSRKNE